MLLIKSVDISDIFGIRNRLISIDVPYKTRA